MDRCPYYYACPLRGGPMCFYPYYALCRFYQAKRAERGR